MALQNPLKAKLFSFTYSTRDQIGVGSPPEKAIGNKQNDIWYASGST
jgi:hypothetical protein